MKRAVASAAHIALSPLGFWKGLTYPFRGANMVYFRERGLAKIWLIPILLTALAFAGLLWASVHYNEAVAAWLLPEDIAAAGSLWERAWDASRTLILWIISVLFVAVGALVVTLLASVLAAPFNDALSEAIEHRLTDRPPPKFSLRHLFRDLGRTLRLEALKLAIYLTLVVPLFIGSWFLPVVGQVLAVVSFLITAMYFAIDYIDWSAARQDWTISKRIALFRRHWATLLGFGVGVWAFLFVPLVNLFFMPAAVAGGTMLFVRLTETASTDTRPQEITQGTGPERSP